MKALLNTVFKLCVLGIIVSYTSCDDDELIVDDSEAYIKEENLFDCGSYQTITLSQASGNDHIFRREDQLFVGGINGVFVYDNDTGALIFSDDTYRVRDFEEFENTVLFCTNEGIYEYVSPTEIVRKNNANCTSLLLTSTNELVFAHNSNSISFDIRRLYLYNAQFGSTPYTSQNSGSMCITMDKLAEASNGDIWAIDCSGNYVRFRAGEYLGVFDNTNSPLFGNNRPVGGSFVEPYGDVMVVVTKNERYTVLKYEGEEWVTLYDLSAFAAAGTERSDQDKEMSLPSIVGAQIKGDFLYVATNEAGCRGFHVFDISKNEMLLPTDYYIVRDPNLSRQCIDTFEIDEDGNIYIVIDDEMIVIDC